MANKLKEAFSSGPSEDKYSILFPDEQASDNFQKQLQSLYENADLSMFEVDTPLSITEKKAIDGKIYVGETNQFAKMMVRESVEPINYSYSYKGKDFKIDLKRVEKKDGIKYRVFDDSPLKCYLVFPHDVSGEMTCNIKFEPQNSLASDIFKRYDILDSFLHQLLKPRETNLTLFINVRHARDFWNRITEIEKKENITFSISKVERSDAINADKLYLMDVQKRAFSKKIDSFSQRLTVDEYNQIDNLCEGQTVGIIWYDKLEFSMFDSTIEKMVRRIIPQALIQEIVFDGSDYYIECKGTDDGKIKMVEQLCLESEAKDHNMNHYIDLCRNARSFEDLANEILYS